MFCIMRSYCFTVSWSPKGKQLVVGQDDGILVQYDQALTRRKVWPCPDMLQGQQKGK